MNVVVKYYNLTHFRKIILMAISRIKNFLKVVSL